MMALVVLEKISQKTVGNDWNGNEKLILVVVDKIQWKIS